jgi:hypothetical protein
MTDKSKSPVIKKSVSEKFIDQFYSINTEFIDNDGNKIDIKDSGFLGLLATGYKGLAMIRKKRGHTHVYAKFTKGKKLVRKNPKDKSHPRKPAVK